MSGPAANRNFPVEFQRRLIDLVRSIIPVSAVRFWLVNPQVDLKGYVSYNVDAGTEEVYQGQYSHLDPMHPSRFENTEDTVICSDTMMSAELWRRSIFYKEFMAPRHFDHDADIFFRNAGKIIAVLSMLRDNTLGAFSAGELLLLQHMQPFLEYSLNNVYLPKRFSERELFSSKFSFTGRELDVVEVVMAGMDIKTMAGELNLSQATVKTHLQHIFEKTAVHSTRELISILFRELNI
jgi:DNA-binding CsgD family transcriptional regulator